MKIFYADWLVRLFELLAFEALMGPCTTCLFEAILTFSLLRPGLKIMLVHDCQNVAGKFKQERYANFIKPSTSIIFGPSTCLVFICLLLDIRRPNPNSAALPQLVAAAFEFASLLGVLFPLLLYLMARICIRHPRSAP